MKRIGILTSGGDCGGLNAAVRSIFYRAKEKYNLDVYGDFGRYCRPYGKTS
ncbi:MAG: hypothetical protein CM15mP65_00230 [Crocinitomicaceae bacterium]|nr:MAG: hypothetical protein CM15mP65_00230 [Crocinitomicaceae bacterium]